MGVGCMELLWLDDAVCSSSGACAEGANVEVGSWTIGQPHSGQTFLSAPTIAPQSGHLVCDIVLVDFGVLADKRAVYGYGFVAIVGKFQIIELESYGRSFYLRND